MSTKLRQIPADRSNFLSTNPTATTNFEVPRTIGFTDLTNSKVKLDMHVQVLDNGATEIAFPTTFGVNGQMVGPQVLISSAKVMSNEFGLLNETGIHQNVIRANLDWYLKSRAREDAQSAFGASTSRNYGKGWADRLPDCPFVSYDGARPRDATVTGTPVTQNATTRRAEIMVPISHIDQFGDQFTYFPNVAMGDLVYQVQFETEYRTMYPATMPSQFELIVNRAAVGNNLGGVNAPLTTTRTGTNFNRPPMIGDFVTLWFKEAGQVVQVVADTIANVTGGAGAAYVVTLTNGATTIGATGACTEIHLFYGESILNCRPSADVTSVGSVIGGPTSLLVFTDYYDNTNPSFAEIDNEQCSFYVGCPVAVVAQNSATSTAHAGYTRVASLVRNGRDLAMSLVTPINIGGGGTDLANQIRVSHRDWRTDNNTLFVANWTIDEAYLRLEVPQLTPAQQESARKKMADGQTMPYIERRVQARNMPTTNTFTEVIQVPPNCMGMCTLSPRNLTFLSGFDQCQEYAYSINGVKNTNRNINVGNIDRTGRQLHNHMLAKFFGNMGQLLNKYDAQSVDFHRIDDTSTHALYPLVTPLVSAPQVIQLELFATNNMTGKPMYYVSFHQRLLKLSNGRLQMV